MKKNIFLAFTIQNSSVSDYYLKLSMLLKEKFNVYVFSQHTDLIAKKNLDCINVYIWPNNRPTRFKDFLFLAKKILKHRPVIMISAFGAVNIFSIVGRIFCIRNRIAWVHTLSTQMESRKFLQYRKSLIYRFCTTIIANSSATKNDLVKNFYIRPKKIKVVYNSIDIPKNQPVNLDFKKITYAGRIHPSKGVDILIKAMSIVIKKYPDIKLEIVGAFLEGETVKKYLQLTKELALQNHIEFVGWKSKNELLNTFRNSYFTVVPSLAEAFGYVVIESFSVKTLVIGSSTGGIAEIIRDGKDGFLFTPSNHNALAEKMIHLLSDNQLRESFSNSCYSRFIDNFETNKVLEYFLAYLYKLT